MKDPFEPECYYHIYNHAVGTDNLFTQEKNYYYFLKKFKEHIFPISETLCYCLMPNHFHFLVKIRDLIDEDELINNPKLTAYFRITCDSLDRFDMINKYTNKRFSNLFSAYAQAFNKSCGRKGSLFSQNFKHKKIASDDYLTTVIRYIHFNPVRHGFTKSVEEWPHSSYHAILSDKPTSLNRKAVLDWFGDKENFIKCHREIPEPELFIREF